MKLSEENWISRRVDEAVQSDPVADDVSLTIKDSLERIMCERALRVSELTVLADILIDATITSPCEEMGK